MGQTYPVFQSVGHTLDQATRSTLDVLQVEQQYFTVLRDLAQARYAYLIAGFKLKGLVGVLSEGDIAGLNAQLISPR